MRTIIILFLLLWTIPCWIFLIVHFHNFRKAWAKIRWWTTIYVLGVFGVLTEWVMFFPAWFTRNIPILKWVFWIWMDDSRFKDKKNKVYSDDYWEFIDGDYTDERIWQAYKWHMRNRVWNLDSLFRPRKGERKIVETVVDRLYMNGQKVDQSLSWIPMARLKYWEDGVEGSQVNSGAFISNRHSIIGRGYVWETVGKRFTFRWSECKEVKFLFWHFWRIMAFGENDKRFVFTVKFKALKQWK